MYIKEVLWRRNR